MVTRKIRHLPVVEGGRVVGIVTETDLLRQIVRTEEARTPDSEAIVVSFP
jgi:CBS domain-containing protein